MSVRITIGWMIAYNCRTEDRDITCVGCSEHGEHDTAYCPNCGAPSKVYTDTVEYKLSVEDLVAQHQLHQSPQPAHYFNIVSNDWYPLNLNVAVNINGCDNILATQDCEQYEYISNHDSYEICHPQPTISEEQFRKENAERLAVMEQFFGHVEVVYMIVTSIH